MRTMKKKKKLQLEMEGKKSLRERLSFFKWIDPFTYADLLLERINKKDNSLVSWGVYLITAFLSALLLYSVLGILFRTPSPMVIVVSGSMEPSFYRGDVMVLTGWTIEQLNAPVVELPNTSIDGVDIARYAVAKCSVKGLDYLVPCRSLLWDLRLGGLKKEDVVAKKIYFPSVDKEIEITKEGGVVVYFSETESKPIIHRVVVKIHAKDGWFVLTKGDSVYNSLIDQDAGLSKGAVKIEELHGKSVFLIPKIGYVKLILLDDIPCFLASPFTGARCQFP